MARAGMYRGGGGGGGGVGTVLRRQKLVAVICIKK